MQAPQPPKRKERERMMFFLLLSQNWYNLEKHLPVESDFELLYFQR